MKNPCLEIDVKAEPAYTKSYWCGWEEPKDIPDEHCVTVWPVDMKAWRTGYGADYVTYTAQIEARSAAAAEAIIRSGYGASADRIAMRWEPRELTPAEIEARQASGRFR